MRVILSADYDLPTGQALTKLARKLLALQKRELLAYLREAPTIAPVSLIGWRQYWYERILPIFAQYVIGGWKFNHGRMRRALRTKSLLEGLVKKASKEERERYGMMAIMAIFTDWMRDEIKRQVIGAVDAILGTTQRWINMAVELYRVRLVDGVDEATARRELIVNAAQTFDLPNRPALIGEDEAIRAYHLGMIGVLRASRYRWMKTWWTAEDEMVCFPAGTLVETEKGLMPIESIVPRIRVKTRLGFKSVVAASRRNYNGDFVDVEANGLRVVATSEHPFWTLEHGWLPGNKLLAGQTLYSSSDEFVQVNRVHHLGFSEAKDVISLIGEEGVLSGVSRTVSVPVNSISLQGDVQAGEQEVDAIAPGLGFLKCSRHEEELYHELCAKSITVYNLQVDGCQEFFANGILVHNCEVCAPLHGVTIPVDQTFVSLPVSGSYASIYSLVNQPPAHPTCRCRLETFVDVDPVEVSYRNELVGV